MHPEGERDAPSVCTQDTLRVNTMHPKSTNINNNENLTLKNNQENEEREIYKKEITEEELETIRMVFKTKRVKVTDKMIRDLLKNNDLDAVKAAIKSTDFSAARNPLAVIKWMLSTGTYVMPAEERIPVFTPETKAPGPGEEEAIKEMIKEAKEGLIKKTMQPA